MSPLRGFLRIGYNVGFSDPLKVVKTPETPLGVHIRHIEMVNQFVYCTTFLFKCQRIVSREHSPHEMQ